MSKNKTQKKKASALWLIPAAGAAVFTGELYRYMFCRKGSKLFSAFESGKGHEGGYYQFRDEAAERFRKIPHKTWSILSKRGDLLKGFYYSCGGQGKRVAFLIHGYRSEHIDTVGMYYDYYRSRDIDIFCCDHTASGESQGDYIGFDVLETEDCLRWIRVLVEKLGPDVEILLHGFSMGAATVMQMSSRCPENVKFIVEDSGYQNARASLKHQIGPLYQPMRLMNRAVARYDIDDSDVTESLLRSRIPMLFVHGEEDRLVPFENGPRLYELYEGEKDCLFQPGTRHIETMYTSPQEYAAKLDSFVEKYFSPAAVEKG